MNRSRKYCLNPLLWLLISITAFNCAPPKLWKGQHMTISYRTLVPKEDFKVGDYVIVAYDIGAKEKRSGIIFRFDLMRYGQKVGVLEIKDRSHKNDFEGYLPLPSQEYKYYLLAGETKEPEKFNYDMSIKLIRRKIHRMYRNVPSYEKAKIDVIKLLTGELMDPVDND